MPAHYDQKPKKRMADDDEEMASLLQIVERRMSVPVEPTTAAEEVTQEPAEEPQPEVELVPVKDEPEAASFEEALEQSMKAASEEARSEETAADVENEEVRAEEAVEEVVEEAVETEVEAEAVYTPEQAAELFVVTHGAEYNPESPDDQKKMQEIEETLVEMGGLGDVTPNRFALDIYRKYKY